MVGCSAGEDQLANTGALPADMVAKTLWGGMKETLPSVKYSQPFGFGEIVRRVGVEERIERLVWPCDGRKTVTRGEAVDLSEVFVDERVAKLLA